jgi:hypothetical protein
LRVLAHEGAQHGIQRAVATGDVDRVTSLRSRAHGGAFDILDVRGDRDVEVRDDRAKPFVDQRQQLRSAIRSGRRVHNEAGAHLT